MFTRRTSLVQAVHSDQPNLRIEFRTGEVLWALWVYGKIDGLFSDSAFCSSAGGICHAAVLRVQENSSFALSAEINGPQAHIINNNTTILSSRFHPRRWARTSGHMTPEFTTDLIGFLCCEQPDMSSKYISIKYCNYRRRSHVPENTSRNIYMKTVCLFMKEITAAPQSPALLLRLQIRSVAQWQSENAVFGTTIIM